MEQCHNRCVEVLKRFLESIPQRLRHRAVDVAGGDGRLSESLLVKQYKKVDLFDICPEAVKKATTKLEKCVQFGYTEVASMQTFKWRYYYGGIFMVWCAGYLDRLELVTFLRVA